MAVEMGQRIAAVQVSLGFVVIKDQESSQNNLHTICLWEEPSDIRAAFDLLLLAGGYLQYIFRTAARELYGIDVPWSEPLPLRVLRNADFREVTLEHDGRAVLRFALAYGFRNIQTIVSRAPPGAPVLFSASLGSS